MLQIIITCTVFMKGSYVFQIHKKITKIQRIKSSFYRNYEIYESDFRLVTTTPNCEIMFTALGIGGFQREDSGPLEQSNIE